MLASIGKNRSLLMGIAAILVLLVHSGLSFDNPILDTICYFGYTGVDIFLLVSGFGLYHSLSRHPSLKQFFSRRMIRIYPSLIPALLVWVIYLIAAGISSGARQSLDIFIGNLSGWYQYFPVSETYWYNWYILALPLYYLCAPLIAYLTERFGTKGMIFMLIASMALQPLFFGQNLKLRLFARFPVYILGFWFGYLDVSHRSLSKIQQIIWMLVSVVFFDLILISNARFPAFLDAYGLWWSAFVWITPGFVMMLCLLFDGLRSLHLPLGWLQIIGSASFEIYLLHVQFFKTWKEAGMQGNLKWGIAIVVMILGGIAWEKLNAVLIRVCTRKTG